MDNKVIRKWGYYLDHYRTPECVMKTLYIGPGKSISYQFHRQRDEFWYIQQGSGELRLDDKSRKIIFGETINILRGTKHKITNLSHDVMIINEMQYGLLCSEDDIVRLDE